MLENLGRFCRDCIGRFAAHFVAKNGAKKRGFTLAEILIALAIIGILAVLVLPAVTTRAQNRAFEISYDAQVKNLLNALESLPITENRSSLTDTMMYTNNPNLSDFSDTSGAFIKKYMKVSKYCGNTPSGCFANQYTEIKNHDKLTYSTNSIKGACAVLKNGVSICIKPQAKPNANEKTYVTGYLDLNGQKGPNVYGRDLRSFMVDVGEAKVYNAENPESVVTLLDIDPDGPSTCEGGICDPCVVDPDSCNNECTKPDAPANFECCKAKYHPNISGPSDACCAYRVDEKCNKCQDSTYKAEHPDECGGSCVGHTITGPSDPCCTTSMKKIEPRCCSDSDDSDFCCSANAFTFGCCKKTAANGDIRDSGHKCCQVFKNNGGENGAFYKKYCTDACTEDNNSEFCCKTPKRQEQITLPTKNANGTAKLDGCCSTNSGKNNKKCCNWNYGSSVNSNDVAKACCNLGGTYIQNQASCCTNDSVFNSNKSACCTYNNDRKKTSACCEFRTGTPSAPSGNTYDACCSANADGSYSIGNQSGQSVNCCKPDSTSAYCCANAFDKLNDNAKKTCCSNNFNAGKCCKSEGKDLSGNDNASCCNTKKTTQFCCNAAGVQNKSDEEVCRNDNFSSCRDCGCFNNPNSSEACCQSSKDHSKDDWVGKCCNYNAISPYKNGSAAECCTLNDTLSNPNKTCCDALYSGASATDKERLKDKCCNISGWQYASVCKPTPDPVSNCPAGQVKKNIKVTCKENYSASNAQSVVTCGVDETDVDMANYSVNFKYDAVAAGDGWYDVEKQLLDVNCNYRNSDSTCSLSDYTCTFNACSVNKTQAYAYGFVFEKIKGCTLYKNGQAVANGKVYLKEQNALNVESYNLPFSVSRPADYQRYVNDYEPSCVIEYNFCEKDTTPEPSLDECPAGQKKVPYNIQCSFTTAKTLNEYKASADGANKIHDLTNQVCRFADNMMPAAYAYDQQEHPGDPLPETPDYDFANNIYCKVTVGNDKETVTRYDLGSLDIDWFSPCNAGRNNKTMLLAQASNSGANTYEFLLNGLNSGASLGSKLSNLMDIFQQPAYATSMDTCAPRSLGICLNKKGEDKKCDSRSLESYDGVSLSGYTCAYVGNVCTIDVLKGGCVGGGDCQDVGTRRIDDFDNTDIHECCVDLADNPDSNPYCCTKDSSDEGCCSYMRQKKGDAWVAVNAPQCNPNPCLSGNMAQCCQEEQGSLNYFQSEEQWAQTCCLQKDASGSKYVIDSDHRCCNYYWDNNSQNYFYTPQKDKGYGKYEDATENICRGGAFDEGCRYQEEELINCQTNFESFDSYSNGYGINDQLKSQYAQYVERQIKGRNGKYPSVTCTVKNGVTGTLQYLDGTKECHYSDWYCQANGYTYIPTSKTFSGGSFTIDNVLQIKSVKINYLNTKNLELVRINSYTYGFKLKLVPNTDVTPCIPEFQQTPYGYGSYCSIAAPTGRMYQYGDKASIVQTGSCSKNLNTQYTYTEKAGSNNDPYHYHSTLHKWVIAGGNECWPPGSDGLNWDMYSSFCKYCTVEKGTVKTFWDFPKHPDDDNACAAHRRVDILACKLNGNTLSPTIIGGKAYCLTGDSPLVVNTGNTYTMNYRCPDLVSWGHGSSEIDSEIKISNQGVLNYHFNFVTEYEDCWDEDVEVDQDCYEEDGMEFCDPVYEQEEVCETRYPDENGNDMLIIIAEIKYSSGGRTHLKTFNVTTSKENNSGSIQLEPDAKLLSGKITYMMRRIRKSDNVDAAPPMVLSVETFEDNEYSSSVTVVAPKNIPCPD